MNLPSGPGSEAPKMPPAPDINDVNREIAEKTRTAAQEAARQEQARREEAAERAKNPPLAREPEGGQATGAPMRDLASRMAEARPQFVPERGLMPAPELVTEPAAPAPEPEAPAPEPTPTTTDSEAPGAGQHVPAQTEREYREEVEAEEAAEAHAASSEEQMPPTTAVSLPVSERTEPAAHHETPSEPGAGGEAAGLTAEEPQPEPASQTTVEQRRVNANMLYGTRDAASGVREPVIVGGQPITPGAILSGQGEWTGWRSGILHAMSDANQQTDSLADNMQNVAAIAEFGIKSGALTPDEARQWYESRKMELPDSLKSETGTAVAASAERVLGGAPPPAEGPGVGRPEQAEGQPAMSDWEEYLAKYGNNYAPGREPKPGQKTLNPDSNVTINEMLRRHGYGMPRPDRDEGGRIKRDKENNVIMRPTTLDDIIADIKANKEYYNGSMTEDVRTPLEKQDQRTLEQIKSDATEYHEQKERTQLDADAKRRDELLGKGVDSLDPKEKKELENLQTKLENAEAQKRASLERQAKAYRAPRGNFGKFIDDAFDAVTGKTAAKEQAEFMRTGKVVFGSEMQLFSHWLAKRKIPVISKLFGTEMSEKDVNAAKKRIADFAPIMMEAFKKAAPRRLLQIYLIFALLFSPAGIMVLSALATGQAFKMMGKSQ